MTRSIAIVNQKGGVGKTTTAMNLATALAAIHKKTLLIDLDPQGNASTGFGFTANTRSPTIYECLTREVALKDAIKATDIPKLDMITSTVDLAAVEVELGQLPNKEFILTEAISQAALQYDYILIDCPPSLGTLTVNALAYVESVLIPMQCEFYALEGLAHLLSTLQLIEQSVNPNLSIEGVVLTMVDRRNRLTTQVEEEVRGYLKGLVYDTIIPRNVRISEAPSHGKPVLMYDVRCVGSQSYLQLAKELLKRQKQSTKKVAA